MWSPRLRGCSNGLGFFSPAAPAGGAYVVSTGTSVANLALGTLVGASSTYNSGGTTLVSQWNLNSSSNYFGFRFFNEASGQVHYGWGQFSLAGTPNGVGRALVAYAYESTPGLAIAVGAVPEPATYGLMALGMAGVLLAARRRKAG